MEIISWNRAFQLHFPLSKVFHFSNQPGMKHFLVHLLQDSQASHVNPIGWMVMWELVDGFSQLFCAG
jgi:hypothetical protein